MTESSLPASRRFLAVGQQIEGVFDFVGRSLPGSAAGETLPLLTFHAGSFGFRFYSGVQAIFVCTPTTVRGSTTVYSGFGT